jgi:predicted chitinase
MTSLRAALYRGRGYVQLSWKKSYAKFGELLDSNLVANPDLAEVGQTRRAYYRYLVEKVPKRKKWLDGWMKRVQRCDEAEL